MAKYRVYLDAIASCSVEVEADNEDAAIDKAFALAPEPGHDWPEISNWYFPPDDSPSLDQRDYIQRISDE